jgi:hypothetical protein
LFLVVDGVRKTAIASGYGLNEIMVCQDWKLIPLAKP